MRIEDATDVFCTSFAFTRSFVSPFEFIRFEGLRILRDAAPRPRPRAMEIVCCGQGPGESLRQIRAFDPPRHFVCAIGEGDQLAADKAAFKAARYRLIGTEDLFVRNLELPLPEPSPHIRRVQTWEEALQVKEVDRRHQIPKDHLASDIVRLYAAWNQDEPVGWVRSIQLKPEATWVSNLYVRTKFRRSGVGFALMARLLGDDRQFGSRESVLLASHVGSLLYPKLGYQRIGVLQLFAPS